MKAELIRYTPEPDELCARAAGKCVGKPGSIKGLQTAIRSGHLSVLEHACFTFDVDEVSRVLLAQITRHRIASFSVESERYVELEEDQDFIVPETIENSKHYQAVVDWMQRSVALYHTLVDDGILAEDARYVVPQGIETTFLVTMNARELRHFFELRRCNRAQKEIRDLADEMFRQCRQVAPVLFGECGPGCMVAGCKEARPCGHPRSKEDKS